MKPHSYPLLADDSTAAHAPIPTATVIPSAVPMGMPAPQTMARSIVSSVAQAPGLVLRERIYLSQLLCKACEKRTSFAIGGWTGAPGHLDDTQITDSLQAAWLGEVREDSDCLCRYCCHQNRETKLGYFLPEQLGTVGGTFVEGGLAGYGWPEGALPELTFDRPFRCTLCCCCCLFNPQEMGVALGSNPLGRSVMECHPFPCCRCNPTFYSVRDAQETAVYHVRVPLACDDGCRNCCAPTCCNPTFIAPVLHPGSNEEVGSIENHWAGCNVRGVCFAGEANNNYVVKVRRPRPRTVASRVVSPRLTHPAIPMRQFPAGATMEHKLLLLGSTHLLDFNFFERRANQN